ncbi:MAG TPA: ATP phosphoribosyltransferase [Thermoanaerobaculia bacterium]|nr:ATP phosphoribosyltransferase [Thermoanaerobaculia bacterium]
MSVPSPNLPRGVQALLFESAERRRRLEDSVVRVLADAGFRETVLPVLDFSAPYDGVTAEGDERLYRFVDRGGELLALRADFTPMAARVVAPRLAGLPMPVALFYRGDVVRDEPSGVGRPREFAQVGAELYGDPSFEADLRMLRTLLAAADGIPAARLVLTLGWAGLLPALLSAVAPGLVARKRSTLDAALADARARRVGKLSERLRAAGATPAAADEVGAALLAGFDPESALFRLPVLAEAARSLAAAARAAREDRPELGVVVDLAGTPAAPYYTGLTFALDAAGGGGSLAAGGRYDGLLGRFGPPAPAVGFCVGLEALASAAEAAEEAPAAPRPFRIATGKGRLLGKTLDLLRAAGVDFPEGDGRRLLLPDRSGRFELLLLKDDDVPTYVAFGGADAGVVGSDRIGESGEEVCEPLELPYGACRLSLIGRAGEEFRPNGHPVRVGTKYRRLAARFFDGRKIPHEVVPLAGSVELAVALRLADVVVDLIETGSTMAAHGLAEIETILPSRATFVVGPRALVERRAEVASLVSRLAAKVESPC